MELRQLLAIWNERLTDEWESYAHSCNEPCITKMYQSKFPYTDFRYMVFILDILGVKD